MGDSHSLILIVEKEKASYQPDKYYITNDTQNAVR